MKETRSVLPSPDVGLRVLATTIRAARLARGLTQQRLADEADVSRGQVALLERGENVSVLFLLKLAHHLKLEEISLDGTVKLTSAYEAFNVAELLRALDTLTTLTEHLRALVVTAVLPDEERAVLKDAPALRAFVDRYADHPEGLSRLEDAIFSPATPLAAPPAEPAGRTRARRIHEGRKRGA